MGWFLRYFQYKWCLCPFSQFVNKLLDKHAPYKIIKYSKTGYETKPWTWITAGLANSIRNTEIYKSVCKWKDPKTKEYYEKKFKSYCNHISSLLRKTKDSYKQYFEDKNRNLRLLWQTVKRRINMEKNSDESISNLLIDA